MKELIYILIGLLFGLIGCTDNSIESIDNTIIGEWDQYETSFSIGGPELQNRKVEDFRIFSFQEDGDMIMWLEGSIYSGSWRTEGSRLLLTFYTQNNLADAYSFEFNSDGDLLLNNLACIEPCIDSFRRNIY